MQKTVVNLRLEQLRKSKPLARHLIAVVGVHELIVVDAVRSVPFHAFDRRLAGVESNDIVDESLTGGREWETLAGVGGLVFGGRGLADLELLAGC
jgi:hypothetical protein